jgi:hypothetical protein
MAAFPRDDNFFPITDKDGLIVSKTVTYVAATTGAVGASTLFTISGPCIVKVIGVCSVNLDSDGAATLEVGIAGSTAGLIAQTAYSGIDAGKFWIDATSAIIETDFTGKMIALDIIQTIATETVKAGSITFYCYWRPMSSTSTCVAA